MKLLIKKYRMRVERGIDQGAQLDCNRRTGEKIRPERKIRNCQNFKLDSYEMKVSVLLSHRKSCDVQET